MEDDEEQDDEEEDGEEEEEMTQTVAAQWLHRAAVVNKLEQRELEGAEELREKEFVARSVELLVSEDRK